MAERLAAELVVVGGGPAGIAAAIHAAESGRSVLLLDPSPRAGGQVWRNRGAPPPAARPWLDRLRRCGAGVLPDSAVIDVPGPGALVVERQGRATNIRGDALVLATGARELLLPFPGWTLPGVVGVGAAQALRESGARFARLRVVVAGSGPLLIATAAALRRAGAQVVGIAEQAPWPRLAAFAAGLVRHPGRLAEGCSYGAQLLATPIRAGAWVREASGSGRVERVVLTDGRREWAWDCDVLACGFGLLPNLELPRLLGCETADERVVTDDAQRTSLAGVYAAGELCGIGGVGQALATGAIAGLAAVGAAVPARLVRQRRRERAFAERLRSAFALRGELRELARPDTLVCRCEDVTLEAVSSHGTLRCAKLHTRAGMGPCQGRVCGAALGFLLGWSADTIRPPLLPVPLSLLAEAAEDLPAPASQEAGR